MLEAHWTGLVTRQLRAFLTTAGVTAMLVLNVSERAVLATGHSLALFGTWATLANLTSVDVGLEAKRAFESATGN